MQTQRFTAPDMRRALRQVREKLGPDTVILSHRRHPEGVELEVAIETVAATPPRPAAATAMADPFAADGGDDAWSRMQRELQEMRDLLEQRLSTEAWGRLRHERPGRAAMWRRLARIGLSPQLCRLLLADHVEESSQQSAWQSLMLQLERLLPVDCSDPVDAGGVHVMIGPAGAGKTTTIAKLAARHVLRHGREGVALVSTDHFRLGAQEQLRTLGRILQVPLLSLGEGESLDALTYRLRHHRLVLVDTPGWPRQDAGLVAQLDAIGALGERARAWQVLATTSQGQVLQADQRAFRTPNLGGVILTKLDEAGSLGEAISLLVGTGLPLTYTANGQNIPGDLAVASARQLISAAIAVARASRCDEESLARDYASSGATGSRKSA